MISPTNATDFDRNERELQKFWLFSLFVAGKNSDFAAQKVDALMNQMPQECEPLDYLRICDVDAMLRKIKAGQYTRLTKAIQQSMGVDLHTATVEDLMKIHGVGPKTSRFFILHSRKDYKCAVLDTHILKLLRDEGNVNVPKSTPSGKAYLHWEQVFLDFCQKNYPGVPIAEVDLYYWMKYSGRTEKDLTIYNFEPK
jgi:hypothetical protein